jgi:undecaprenyl-diphosphatase
MTWYHVVILALIQGAAELLPVSSSAHVILAERLLGLDPARPELTFLLVMLHTGTMLAVIQYYWPRWRVLATRANAKHVLIATACTGVLGLALKLLIEKVILGGPKSELEELFRSLPLMACALVAAGTIITAAGMRESAENAAPLTGGRAAAIGLMQGLCLPFRGFSRSGATISTGLFLGLPRATAEEFSFALAVVVTPPVILLQLRRLHEASGDLGLDALAPGLAGMLLAAVSGAVALRFLSQALERGRFKYFGLYCFCFAAVVLLVSRLA